jgi:hypothetical protein
MKSIGSEAHPIASRRVGRERGIRFHADRRGAPIWPAALLALGLFAQQVLAAIPASERTVLVNLYAGTNGADWTASTNWNGAAGTECTWYGITCNAGGTNVTGIALPNNNLTGNLPAIADLTNLTLFNVNHNQLTGSIPAIASLTQLVTFAVPDNQLTGPIPALTGLTHLMDFEVEENLLTGTIPALGDLSSLVNFVANNNELTGPIPDLSGMTALESFYVEGNGLTGPLPAAPGSLVDGQSNLCPNPLAPAAHPPSANDDAWTAATDTTPWSLNCTTYATTVIVHATPNPVMVGASVTVSFTVAHGPVPIGGELTPTGTVTVVDSIDNSATCTATLSGGSRSCTLTFATGGAHTLTAGYVGDPTFAPSSGAASETVNVVVVAAVATSAPALGWQAVILLGLLLAGSAWSLRRAWPSSR